MHVAVLDASMYVNLPSMCGREQREIPNIGREKMSRKNGGV